MDFLRVLTLSIKNKNVLFATENKRWRRNNADTSYVYLELQYRQASSEIPGMPKQTVLNHGVIQNVTLNIIISTRKQ